MDSGWKLVEHLTRRRRLLRRRRCTSRSGHPGAHGVSLESGVQVWLGVKELRVLSTSTHEKGRDHPEGLFRQKSSALGQILGTPTIKGQGEKEKAPKKEKNHRGPEKPGGLSMM